MVLNLQRVLFILLLSVSVSCKKTITGEGPLTARQVSTGNFTGISLNTPAEVTIVISDSINCIITAQENIFNALNVDVDGRALEISSDYNLETESPITMVVSMPEVEKVQINGSGIISFLNTAEGEELRLYINGSGDILAKAEAREIKSRINGSGAITLSGSCAVHECSINGSGNLHAFNCLSDEVEIDINGSGDAEVAAAAKLKVNIKGSGDVIYKGQPHLETEIMGNGEIKKSE